MSEIPEYVPVLLLEQFIFLTLGLGFIFLVTTDNNALPSMQTSLFIANGISFTLTLFVFTARVNKLQTWVWCRVQKLAFIYMITYNIQYITFCLVVRLYYAEKYSDTSKDVFIILFNSDARDPYGYNLTTLHMIVSIILCCVVSLLFTATHSFLRGSNAENCALNVPWSMVIILLFIQSQFFLFHSDNQAKESNACTNFVCDKLHTVMVVVVITVLGLSHVLLHYLCLYLSARYSISGSPLNSNFFVERCINFFYSGVFVFFLAISILFLEWLQSPYFKEINICFLVIFVFHAMYKVIQPNYEGVGLDSMQNLGKQAKFKSKPAQNVQSGKNEQDDKSKEVGTRQKNFVFFRGRSVTKKSM